MTSWNLNVLSSKIWFSRERKEHLKWNKKLCSLFRKCSPLDLKNKLGKMYRLCPLRVKTEGSKTDKAEFFNKKIYFLEKKGFFGFYKNLIHWYLFFTLKMEHSNVLYDSTEIPCFGKTWSFSYGLKFSQPIRLQHSLIVNISRYLRFFAWW